MEKLTNKEPNTEQSFDWAEGTPARREASRRPEMKPSSDRLGTAFGLKAAEMLRSRTSGMRSSSGRQDRQAGGIGLWHGPTAGLHV